MCNEYNLFSERKRDRFLTIRLSKLVRSLTVRLEVLSPCRTRTDVSRLVRSQQIKYEETRVSSHPRSIRQGSRLRSNGSKIRIRKSTNNSKFNLIKLRKLWLKSSQNSEITQVESLSIKARNEIRTPSKKVNNRRISTEVSKQILLKIELK